MSGSSIPSTSDEDHRDRTHPAEAVDLLGGLVACSFAFDGEPDHAGDIVVLRLAGEIDLRTVPILRDALTAAAGRDPADLVVDLADVAFCCVQGFAMLAEAARAAKSRETGFALSGLAPHLNRAATLLKFEARGLRYRSVAAAVHGIRADHTYRPAQL